MSTIESETDWPPRFSGRWWIVVAFGLAVVFLTIVTNQLQSWILGSDVSWTTNRLAELPSFVVLGVLAVVAIRAEKVDFASIGVSRRHARIGAAAVAGIVVVFNVIVIGLAVIAGNDLSVGLYAQYARILDAGPPLLVIGAINSYLFTGPAEELAFRGYLQNKVIALLGDRSTWVRTGLGIMTTAVIFAMIHLPNLLLDEGSSLGQAAGGLVLLMFSAILFGMIYELTQNLVLVTLLHGIGNFWPLIVDPGPGVWPNYGIVLVVYLALIVVYRRVALNKRLKIETLI